MIPVKKFKKQHKEICELVDVLSLLIPDEEARATKITGELFAELAEKIKIHFSLEDGTLYKELLVHDNTKIRHTAEGFLSGSRELKHFFSDYLQHLNHQGESKKKGDAFVKESAEIFRLLKKRIKTEEGKLYPLVE